MEPKGSSRGGVSERQPQVAEQVGRLEKAVAHLAEVRSNIEQRLGMVLTPCAPACDKQPTAPRAQMVPLAETLDSITETVNGLRVSMESMLSRIEL